MGDFKRLIAWQKARAFSIAVHAAYRGSRANVSPGLRSQIADIAYASAKEVENDLIKSRDLRILSRAVFEDLVTQGDEVARLCFGLARIPPERQEAPPSSTPGLKSDV